MYSIMYIIDIDNIVEYNIFVRIILNYFRFFRRGAVTCLKRKIRNYLMRG